MKRVLLSLLLLQTGVSLAAKIETYPDYPAALERDDAYAVSVTDGRASRPLTVYNRAEKSALTRRIHGGDGNRRFCAFAFSGGPVRVDIRVRRDVTAYKVFPARLGLRSAFRNGVLSVGLAKPTNFGIQLNDDDNTILSVFAEAPEDPASVPQKGAPGVFYVEGWVDGPQPGGALTFGKETKEIYVAPGAVLNARLVVEGDGTRLHGRGLVLDPLSDIFRYDQTKNERRGVVSISGRNVTVEDLAIVDARTFCWCVRGKGHRLRNVKALASMMCSDALTVGGRDFRAEDCWFYVGDNALVISGLRDSLFRNVALGTSCAAVFPQGTNAGVTLEDVDVFRADDGFVNNWHNGILARKNKWSELSGGLQKKEPGPQDLAHQEQDFLFRNVSAVDCTLFSHFFSGRNMGTKPKRFVFDGCSVPPSTGRTDWRSVGRSDGPAIHTRNDPARWLVTDNYALVFTNLYIGGVRARFSERDFDNPANVAVAYAETAAPRRVPLAADRHAVSWTCPRPRVRAAGPDNLVEETVPTRSVWQRAPSWSVKLEATQADAGARVYRLVQCERWAGMQANVTDGVRARGNGAWTLAFDCRARSETKFSLNVVLESNEKKFARKVPIVADGAWHRHAVTLQTDFDLAVTDLVSLGLFADNTADEICLKNLDFRKKGN